MSKSWHFVGLPFLTVVCIFLAAQACARYSFNPVAMMLDTRSKRARVGSLDTLRGGETLRPGPKDANQYVCSCDLWSSSGDAIFKSVSE